MGQEGTDLAATPRRHFGFWGAKTHAIDSLARAEGLLEMMKLSTADFATPQMLLEEARTLLALKDYRKSLKAAEQAERLAEIIEERHRAARKALGILKSEITQLEELGLDTSEAQAALELAKERIKQGTLEDGVRIPNYLEARINAEEAAKGARAIIIKAREASDAVFTAQLALDALRDMEGAVSQQLMEDVIMAPLDEMMQRSTVKIAEGNLEEALTLATLAEERANGIRVDYMECVRSLDSCQNILNGLTAEGVIVGRAAQVLEGGKNLLLQAKVSDAREAIARAEKEALMVSNQYRKAATSIEGAELALRNLSKSGMSDPEAEKRLKDAKKALSDGKYLRALDLADECRKSASKKVDVHDDLAHSLREMRQNVENLRKEGVQYADEVEEILSRAEREYEEGNYLSCGKDMKIASVLLGTSGSAGKIPLYLLRESGK